MLNGGSMEWGFCVYFVYMIPLETDVLRKHRFQKMKENWGTYLRSLFDKLMICCQLNFMRSLLARLTPLRSEYVD